MSPDGVAKLVQVKWYGGKAMNVTFEDATRAVNIRLVCRNEEPTIEILSADYGPDGLLVELTESESIDPLDRFIASLAGLVDRADAGVAEIFHEAPRYTARCCLDEVAE